MLVLELLALLVLGAKLAPGSALDRGLIQAPAEALARMTARGALLAVLGFVMLLAFLAAGPEMIALLGLADLSVLADIAALVLLTGVTARFESVRQVGLRLVRRVAIIVRRAARPRRPRLARPPRPSRDDPAPGVGSAFGGQLGRALLQASAQGLRRLSSGHTALSFAAAVLLVAFVVFAPELAVLFGLADLSLLADFTALAILVGVPMRLGAVRHGAVRAVRQAAIILRRGVRRRQSRTAKSRRPSRDDPAPGPGWAFA